MYDLKGSKK